MANVDLSNPSGGNETLRGPTGITLGSPLTQSAAQSYNIEFLEEVKPICFKISPINGLSPISSMALSLRSFHIKRPLDDDFGSTSVKRPRKLFYDEVETPSSASETSRLHPLKGRRRNFRAIKSLIRDKSKDANSINSENPWLGGN